MRKPLPKPRGKVRPISLRPATKYQGQARESGNRRQSFRVCKKPERRFFTSRLLRSLRRYPSACPEPFSGFRPVVSAEKKVVKKQISVLRHKEKPPVIARLRRLRAFVKRKNAAKKPRRFLKVSISYSSCRLLA